ncbi:hypothetical protein B7P43_G13458 [Cryptotermes secundus]|uniref:Uncharacterized protein n=1 Tax=Cryptotermes secundus TaxID=105785 RepID=A0A2J7RBK2_9NEOP|nr:hypothetical protein B7P43_G13458 [Cryptotermes secundus]
MNSPTYPFSPTAIPSHKPSDIDATAQKYYTAPVQQQVQPPDINYMNNESRGQQIQKITSFSEEEEEETQNNNNNKWQIIRSTKRKKAFN